MESGIFQLYGKPSCCIILLNSNYFAGKSEPEERGTSIEYL